MTISLKLNPLNVISSLASRREAKEMSKAALDIIEQDLATSPEETLLALRKIQENTKLAAKSSLALEKIYNLAYPEDSKQDIYSQEIKASAQATLQMIINEQIPNSRADDLKTILFSRDDKQVLLAVANLMDQTQMVARDSSGNLNAFKTFMQKLFKSPDKSMLEAQVNKMINRAGADRSASGQFLKKMVSEKVLSFFDNQIELQHSNLEEYQNLRNLHGDLVKLNRDKVFDIALRAAQEKCLCDSEYKPSLGDRPDPSTLPIKPKSEITAYLLLMLKELPDTDNYRAAQKKVIQSFKSMGETLWLINDEQQSLREEREKLYILRQEGKGSELLPAKLRNEDGSESFLSVNERFLQIESRLRTLDSRRVKFEQNYNQEISLTAKFLENLDKLTGNDQISNLIRHEIFNTTDENMQNTTISQWMSIDRNFLNESVEAQITGYADKKGTVQGRIISKLSQEYQKLNAERELLEIKQQELIRQQRLHETEKLGLKTDYSPTTYDLDSRVEMFKDKFKANNANTAAKELSEKVEQTIDRHLRIFELLSNLNPELSDVQKLRLPNDRDDYQPLINHIAKLRTVYEGVEAKAHVLDDLRSLQTLLREDRAAYHEELVLYGKSLVYENKTGTASVPLTNLSDFEKNISNAEILDKQIKEIDDRLAHKLDRDQVFQDLQNKKLQLAQEIPSLQASSLVMNLTQAALITESSSKELVNDMALNIEEMFSQKTQEPLPLLELFNSFFQFVVHYINETFNNVANKESQTVSA